MVVKVLVEGEVNIIAISGRLEFERTKILKDAMVKSLKGKKVIFQMDQLSFVGSAGIKNFFKFLEDLYLQKVIDLRIVGLNEEFMRLLSFSGVAGTIFQQNFEEAMHSILGLTPDANSHDHGSH